MDRRRFSQSFAFFNLMCVAFLAAHAELMLPSVIGDHMVLQRGMDAPIWGKADPGEEVAVSICDETSKTTADKVGKWMVKIAVPVVDEPVELVISAGEETETIQDVLVGEVWICSGQSNMEWRVKNSNNAEAEIAAADHPDIRLFVVSHKTSDTPLDDCEGAWVRCSPETIADFSAVAYYFGLELYETLDVPIGLIKTAWGGTPAEAWTALPELESEPVCAPVLKRWDEIIANYPQAKAQYDKTVARWREQVRLAKAAGNKPPRKPSPPTGPDHPHRPASLYNGMLAPLIPYGIRGAIWYQGESNASRAYQYRTLFPLMITNWREAWGQGDFPFYFVQLANYRERKPQPGESDWAELREAQSMALELPNTGMAVAIDIGEADNIHPKNKQDVGKRLALHALALDYGEDVVYSGPVYESMHRKGDKIVLRFKHAAGGLEAVGGERLEGFAIAGADRKFVWADAEIDGDKVVVSSDKVEDPVAVRYGWADNPECNLYNAAGLPASPFRTDEWPGVTAGAR